MASFNDGSDEVGFLETLGKCEAALTENDRDVELYAYVAASYINLGGLIEAMEWIEKGLAVNDRVSASGQLYAMKGFILLKENKTRQALHFALKGLEINDKNARFMNPHYVPAALYAKAKDYAKAVTHYEAAVKIEVIEGNREYFKKELARLKKEAALSKTTEPGKAETDETSPPAEEEAGVSPDAVEASGDIESDPVEEPASKEAPEESVERVESGTDPPRDQTGSAGGPWTIWLIAGVIVAILFISMLFLVFQKGAKEKATFNPADVDDPYFRKNFMQSMDCGADTDLPAFVRKELPRPVGIVLNDRAVENETLDDTSINALREFLGVWGYNHSAGFLPDMSGGISFSDVSVQNSFHLSARIMNETRSVNSIVRTFGKNETPLSESPAVIEDIDPWQYDIAKPERFKKDRIAFEIDRTRRVIDCTECGGSGEIPCPRCSRSGQPGCVSCNGKGVVKCKTCDGGGQAIQVVLLRVVYTPASGGTFILNPGLPGHIAEQWRNTDAGSRSIRKTIHLEDGSYEWLTEDSERFASLGPGAKDQIQQFLAGMRGDFESGSRTYAWALTLQKLPLLQLSYEYESRSYAMQVDPLEGTVYVETNPITEKALEKLNSLKPIGGKERLSLECIKIRYKDIRFVAAALRDDPAVKPLMDDFGRTLAPAFYFGAVNSLDDSRRMKIFLDVFAALTPEIDRKTVFSRFKSTYGPGMPLSVKMSFGSGRGTFDSPAGDPVKIMIAMESCLNELLTVLKGLV